MSSTEGSWMQSGLSRLGRSCCVIQWKVVRVAQVAVLRPCLQPRSTEKYPQDSSVAAEKPLLIEGFIGQLPGLPNILVILFCFTACLFYFKTGSHDPGLTQSWYLSEDGLELPIFLLLPPEVWDSRCAPPCPVGSPSAQIWTFRAVFCFSMSENT